MYYIIENGIYTKTGEIFYLYDFDEKKKLSSFSTDKNKALAFENPEDAQAIMNRVPKTLIWNHMLHAE